MDIYFDFTCPYSRRTGRWWQDLDEPARWRPFVLREVHRDDDGPAEWDRTDALDHVSILALALHQAVAALDADAAAYRWQAMEMFERGPVDTHALRQVAARIIGRPVDDDAVRAGLAEVGKSHQQALSLSVFGTPTLVAGTSAVYLKLSEQPVAGRARNVYEAVRAVLIDTPEVAEVKRPG